MAGEGGEGGIRTLDTGLSPYNGLANRPFRPLRHLSEFYLITLPVYFQKDYKQTGPLVRQSAEPLRLKEAKVLLAARNPKNKSQIPTSYIGIWDL